jgi:hypothetical protein
VQAEIDFRTGAITLPEYLERSNAIGDYLEKEGISLEQVKAESDKRANAAYEQAWASAVQEFLTQSDWPGGNKNLALMNTTLLALGLTDAEDKVAALQTAYESMKKDGIIFDREATEAEVMKSVEKLSPQELLEMWKSVTVGDTTAGDASKANDAFVRAFSRSGSGLFNR